jgi:hypothetical protein
VQAAFAEKSVGMEIDFEHVASSVLWERLCTPVFHAASWTMTGFMNTSP